MSATHDPDSTPAATRTPAAARLCYVVTHPMTTCFLRGQLAYMRGEGFDVMLVTSPGAELDRFEKSEGIAAVRLPMEREIRPWRDLQALVRLYRVFRTERPQIVNAGTPKAGLLGMLASWAAGVPVRIYTLHGLRLETARGAKRALLAVLERLACRLATRVICVSESLRDSYLQHRLAPAEKLVVLGSGSCNGLDASRFARVDDPQGQTRRIEVRQKLGIGPEAFVIGAVGRLTRDKGVADVLAVFDRVHARHPETHLLLIGDFEEGDPLPEECVRRIKSDERIHWTGQVADVAGDYPAMDLLVHASSREGLPYAPLEAAAAGLAVVGYRVTGVVDAVRDGETGCLVAPGDVAALSEAACRYLADPDLRRRHGAAGRTRVDREFLPQVVWANLREQYETLLNEKRSTFYAKFGKRLLDLAIAAPLVVLLSPLLLLLALVVRWRLGGPVLFWQQRPGLRGEPFWMPKFRTMTDERGPDGELLADDQRLTRFGRFLRAASLDELPELCCVVRGQMSLVGPRPLLMEYLDRYTPQQARRHEAKPGITGWAQVNGRNAISWDEKFRLDTWYVDHVSLRLDVRIMWLTLWHVLRMKGVSKQGYATTDRFVGATKRRPRIGFAGDRDIAVWVLDYLLAEGDRPELLLVPAADRATHADALVERCGHLPKERILRGASFRDAAQVDMIRSLELDYIISIHFPYVYPPELLHAARGGILNLHPSYLPHGRGWHTPSWAILEDCPYGATLHVVDEGIDTGDILHQLQLAVRPDDTAHTLYQRVKRLELEVFRQAWPRVRDGSLTPRPQRAGGAVHKRRELLAPTTQQIELDTATTARSLLRRLRALTTDRTNEAAYFEEGGRRYRVRVEVSPDEQVSGVGCRVSERDQANPALRPIHLSPPHMSPRERELLLEAFDSNWIAPLGPHVDAFERELAAKVGARHAVALSSCTAALHLALLAAGVKPGDSVLTSTLTFAATANAIRYVGAEPVFIDSELTSWNIDPQLVEDELREAASRGRLPKAAVVVDICGQCADWAPIHAICRRYGVALIEDAAEALGATYRGQPAGTLGDIGCFSFNGNKIITTSGGGMLVTENEAWARQVRHLATQARDPAPHYQHSQVGYNYRLSNLLAAVGRGQLAVLEERLASRRANFEFYRAALADVPGIEFMPEAEFGRATRWLTCLLIDPQRLGVTPGEVCAAMTAAGVEARPMWKPMHQQPAFAEFRARHRGIADDIFRRGLCLPSGSNLTDDDRRRVVRAFRSSLARNKHLAAA